jgi:hypothetical protein
MIILIHYQPLLSNSAPDAGFEIKYVEAVLIDGNDERVEGGFQGFIRVLAR